MRTSNGDAPTFAQASVLSRLFSSGVFREMAKNGRSPLFARLISESRLPFDTSGSSVGEAFDAAFSVLRRSGLRDEYVYRAALTHNVLLGTHSLNTACMLTEFRVGTSKADVAILNGTASVYEIKSERDSLARLANQISNYRKVFAKVYVVAGEAHVQEVISNTPTDVGVMSLARWDRIRTVREATDRSDAVCQTTILESLRTAEACAILSDLGIAIPDVPNTLMRSALRQSFSDIHPTDVHRSMVKILKRTRNLAPLGALVDRLPKSLQPAALSTQIRRADHDRIIEAVQTPLVRALNWA